MLPMSAAGTVFAMDWNPGHKACVKVAEVLRAHEWLSQITQGCSSKPAESCEILLWDSFKYASNPAPK
jgi:hypothetical protein